MEQGVSDSDFVIVICTPGYAERANNRVGGVGYESMVITGELAENILGNKFIPVLFSGTWKESMPAYLKSRAGVDLSKTPYSESEYERLVRVLHGEPIKPPPLAAKPDFSRKTANIPIPETNSGSKQLSASALPESVLGPMNKRPNAIFSTQYDKKGAEVPWEHAIIRQWNLNGGDPQYSFESSRGEEYLGTKREAVNRFFAFQSLLIEEGYGSRNSGVSRSGFQHACVAEVCRQDEHRGRIGLLPLSCRRCRDEAEQDEVFGGSSTGKCWGQTTGVLAPSDPAGGRSA